jgi:hypothetical protein
VREGSILLDEALRYASDRARLEKLRAG